jgi:adenosylcobinamide-phosphate synthase
VSLLAILVALGLEQWRAFRWRGAVERGFVRYVRGIERRLNGGTTELGVLATAVALGPPVVVAAGAYWLLSTLHPLLGFAWNVAVLYLLMGFRRFSYAYSAVASALEAGDVVQARRALHAHPGPLATLLPALDRVAHAAALDGARHAGASEPELAALDDARRDALDGLRRDGVTHEALRAHLAHARDNALALARALDAARASVDGG